MTISKVIGNDWATSLSLCFEPQNLVILPMCDEIRDPNSVFHHSVCYVKQPFRTWILPVLASVPNTSNRVYRVGRVRRDVFVKQIYSGPYDHFVTLWEDTIRLVELGGFRQHSNCGGVFFMRGKHGKIFITRFTWSSSKNKWVVHASFPNESPLHTGSLIFSPKIQT